MFNTKIHKKNWYWISIETYQTQYKQKMIIVLLILHIFISNEKQQIVAVFVHCKILSWINPFGVKSKFPANVISQKFYVDWLNLYSTLHVLFLIFRVHKHMVCVGCWGGRGDECAWKGSESSVIVGVGVLWWQVTPLFSFLKWNDTTLYTEQFMWKQNCVDIDLVCVDNIGNC